MNIFDRFEEEHKQLLKILNQIQKNGAFNRESRKLLFSAKTLLIEHLHNEDEILYPSLLEMHQEDQKAIETIKNFVNEMQEASQFILNFFEKYKDEDKDDSFIQDYAKLLIVLTNRIKREESDLFALSA